MNPEVEARLRSLVSFPSPPGVARHIIELARDPDIEMGRVAKALSMDSALSSKVLRIANSPLYAQRRKSENLRQALVVLGLNATLTLALSFTLVKSLRAGKAGGGSGLGSNIEFPFYWRRALLAATAGRALADAMRHPQGEEIFLAALLQDVGMLALDQGMLDLYRGSAALQRRHGALAEMEKLRVDTDHAEIGGWLMRHWNLPERICNAIGRSHSLELSFTADLNRIFERCVAFSGTVADLFLLDADERQFAQTAQTAERCLGLDKLAFGQMLGSVGAMIPETEAIFESESLARQHPDLILEQAREALVLRSLHALREMNTLRAVAEISNSRALELQEENRRDPLTGVYNRAHLDQILEREFVNASRHNWPLSVAFADLDSFKSINDRFGHQAGDRILQATARILRGSTRETDFIARYGGEEFLIILPATDAATARSVCERIVAAFRNTEHVVGSGQTAVTVSIGCATHGGGTTFASPADFVRAADQALYTAKLRGRNRTVPFDGQMPTPLAARGG